MGIDYLYSMHDIIIQNQIQIDAICEKHHVEHLYLFGSAVSGNLTETSDFDILVDFKPIPTSGYATNFFSLKDELEFILERKVDLITQSSLRNPYFIQSVEQTKQKLYAA